jgi:hypothetical protein
VDLLLLYKVREEVDITVINGIPDGAQQALKEVVDLLLRKFLEKLKVVVDAFPAPEAFDESHEREGFLLRH